MNNPIKIILAVIFAFAVFPLPVFPAESYDFYVDQSYAGEEKDGSKKRPFTKISEAVARALENKGSGRKIFVANGVYEELVVAGKSVEIHGQDKNKTIISGAASSLVRLEGNNVLDNLTISGGNRAVIAEKRAVIKNCIIKNFRKTGIDALPGEYALEISDSKIYGGGKGVYVQKERRISITGNEIYNNGEEGLDIRNATSGLITGNLIRDNGEGGIEIIIGGSKVLINKNDVRSNSSSGIAVQFYSIANGAGTLKIHENKFIGNGKYGIFCGAPSGGNIPPLYWKDSVDLEGNRIEKNRLRAISRNCGLAQAISERDVKTNIIAESEEAVADTAKEQIELEAREEEQLKIDREKEEISALEEMRNVSTGHREQSSRNREIAGKQNRLKIFFFGFRSEHLNALNQSVGELRSDLERAKEYREQLTSEAALRAANDEIGFLEDELSQSSNLLNKLQNSVGLWKRILKFFNPE